MTRATLLSIVLATSLTQSVDAADLPTTPPKADSFALACNPSVVQSGDKIQISFPKAHGGNLAVVDPAGTYFFIVFNQPDATSPVQPVISGSEFIGMEKMELSVRDARGVNWSRKDAAKERIFTRLGTYKILVAPSLETEDPVLDGWCHIRIAGGGGRR